MDSEKTEAALTGEARERPGGEWRGTECNSICTKTP